MWKIMLVRKAFEGSLPEDITWRQKEQFSDGVGYGWIDTLKEIALKEVSDDQMKNAKYKFPVNTTLPNPFPYKFFVAVNSGGINKAITY